MHTVEHLRHLFAYNDWANRRILVAVKECGSEKCLGIFAHILAAEEIWYARLYGADTVGREIWPKLSVEECGERARTIADKYEKLVRGFDEEGLDGRLKYRNSSGTGFGTTFRETLTHVLMHSATHRGNIILKLREEGGEPPKTDYIIYLRETKYI